MTLIEKIRYAQKNGYSIKFIAKNLNISASAIYAYVGKRNYNMSLATQQRIENYIDSLNIDETKKYTVYMHRNKQNQKVYIGLTSEHNPTVR